MEMWYVIIDKIRAKQQEDEINTTTNRKEYWYTQKTGRRKS